MSTGTPKVSVVVANGNLERQLNIADGVPAIVGTALSVGLIGVVKTVYNYADAVAKGFTEADEPFLNKQIKEFYAELGGGKKLYILGCEDTQTWTDIVSPTSTTGVRYLVNQTQGEVTHVFVCYDPPVGYDAGEDFLAVDVVDAVLDSKTLCEDLQNKNRPIRILLAGYVANVGVAAQTLNNRANGYVGVVIGGSDGSGHATAVALARAVKYDVATKIGNGQNGPLTLDPMYIGSKLVTDFFPEELDVLSDKGYILPTTRDGQAGFYYGVDNMCSDDDFRILVHGSVIDKAQRIAVAELTPQLETSVRLNTDGTIKDTDAKHLEETVTQDLLNGLAGQISNARTIVPTDQNIVNSSTSGVQIGIIPLGYLTWINVTIGLTSNQ